MFFASETGYTRGPVTVSISAQKPEKTYFFVYDYETWEKIDEDLFPASEATFEVDENKDLVIVVRSTDGDRHVPLYITNILKEAPPATIVWYFHEFSSYELPDGVSETSEPVTAYYVTDVPTMPYDGTLESYTFYPWDTTTSYTFKYMDPAGNVGSVTADLEEAGIRLVPSAGPAQDDAAPEYDIYIYKKLNGDRYESVGRYSGESETRTIEDILMEIGYVQEYKFVINVTETSPYKIILRSGKYADVNAVTYNSTSDAICGNGGIRRSSYDSK